MSHLVVVFTNLCSCFQAAVLVIGLGNPEYVQFVVRLVSPVLLSSLALSPRRPLLSNTAYFSNILNISFDGLVLVAVSVSGTGAPRFSSIHSPYHF
jgi:hypothetical protein